MNFEALAAEPPTPPVAKEVFGDAILLQRRTVPLLEESLMSQSLSKALYAPVRGTQRSDSASTSGSVGTLEHPFDMGLANRMTDLSTYHGSCQRTLISFACGQGVGIIDEAGTAARIEEQKGMGEVDSASMLPMIDEEATTRLYEYFDAIADHGFDHCIAQMVGNLFGIGNGYLELQRAEGRSVTGLWWLPGHQVWKHQLNDLDSRAYCWKYCPDDEYSSAGMQYMRRHLSDGSEFVEGGGITEDQLHPNEVLDFQLPTTRWRHYGAPQWLAAVPLIEVDWKALQRVSDYMHNNGVPECVIVIGGVKLSPDQLASVQAALGGGGGLNYGKGAFLSFPNGSKDRIFFEVQKIGQSLEGSGWAETHSAVNLGVASANQVLPVLAGITVPGKLGASNEVVLAMVLLQGNVIAPVQRYVAKRLSACLLGRECGGPPGLVGRKLRFRTALEASDIVALNTVARQREQVAENPKRDPKEGLKRG
jgi:hypothetical protein